MILGCDVSAYQGLIDWPRVANAGVKFAFLRCSIGPKDSDTKYALNVKGAKDAGLYVGSYHFAYCVQSKPEEQARAAYARSDALGTQPGELPPVLDMEWPEPEKWSEHGLTSATIASWTLAYLAEAERLWGRVPILYTYVYFWKALGAEGKRPAFTKHPLWIAHYQHTQEWMPPDTAAPFVPGAWTDWTFWQFSANGGLHIPGIGTDIDRNVFRGDLDGLRRLAMINPEAITQPDLPDLGEHDEEETQFYELDGGKSRRDMISDVVHDDAKDEIDKR